jgi:hypothetical protein
MSVPGAYFRDETIWRGRQVAAAYQLTKVLYILGFLSSLMYLAFAVSKWCGNDLLMISAGVISCFFMVTLALDAEQNGKRVEKEIGQYFDENYGE